MPLRHMSDLIRDQKPVTLPPNATVQDACQCMRKRRVGAVLVTKEPAGRLVGIFTGRDAVGRVLAQGRDPTTTKLSQVMTKNPDTMPPGKNALEALRQMQDGGYRHIPIVEGNQLLGVVSRGDFRAMEKARLDEETGLWERIW